MDFTLDPAREGVDSDATDQPFPSPAQLKARLPLNAALMAQIEEARQTVAKILTGQDPRRLFITGPCSLHDPEAMLEYGRRLLDVCERVKDVLFPLIRVYPEKPRSEGGWRGFATDPALDDSFDMARGLEESRSVMIKLADMGLPLATESLSPFVLPYLSDLPAWVAIGARTSASPVHRDMAAGIPAPVGFKNATDGSWDNALRAMSTIRNGQLTLGLDDAGRIAPITTPGNPYGHLVLRGSESGPNVDAQTLNAVCETLQKNGAIARVVVDASHGNSGKDPFKQADVIRHVLRDTPDVVAGFMLESHLEDGNQTLSGEPLRYGVSITDACLGWAKTESLMLDVADTLRKRVNP